MNCRMEDCIKIIFEYTVSHLYYVPSGIHDIKVICCPVQSDSLRVVEARFDDGFKPGSISINFEHFIKNVINKVYLTAFVVKIRGVRRF